MVTQPYQSGVAAPQTEREDPTIVYPYEDDEPLAESLLQYVPLTNTVSALMLRYQDRTDVFVAGDMFVYYRMNVVEARVAPDVFVVFGASGDHPRDSWLIWREGGIAPTFVMEIASQSTWRRDATDKRDIYAEMGVTEYWRFDPTGVCFTPPLVGEQLVAGEYRPIPVATDSDGMLRGYSDVLGLNICVRPELELRLFDPVRGEWLLTHQEDRARREAAEAALGNAEAALEASEAERAAAESALEAALRRISELEANRLENQS